MKFINQLKQTETLANIEKEAATFENMEQEAGLDAEESLGVEADGLTAMDTVNAIFRTDDFKQAYQSGVDQSILNFFVQSN